MFDAAALAAAEVAEEVFGSPVTIFLPDEGRISFRRRTSNQLLISTAEEEIAQGVFDHGRKAGRGMERFPDAAATYVPLKGVEPDRGRDGDSRDRTGRESSRPISNIFWICLRIQTALAD